MNTQYSQGRNSSKKLFAIILATIFLLVSISPQGVNAATKVASDTKNHWAKNEISSWQSEGLLKGDDSGNVRPNDKITRAEFMAFVNRMLGLTEKVEAGALEKYKDVSKEMWYYDTIATALKAGYITGLTAEKMDPNGAITRQQAMAIMARISKAKGTNDGYKKAKDADKVANWAKEAVSSCIDNGFIAGFQGNIQPLLNITRAEAVVMLNRKKTDTRTFSFAGTYNLKGQKIKNIKILDSGIALEDAEVSDGVTIGKNVEKVSLKGQFEKIVSEGRKVKLDLQGKAKALEVNGNMELTGKAKIEKIETTTDVTINGTEVKKGTKVADANIDAKEGEENSKITCTGILKW